MNTLHDTTTCKLCAALAAGRKTTRNGVEISPLCFRCGYHHWQNTGCYGVPLLAAMCPRCGQGRRAVEDLHEAGRDDRKRYSRYCAPCMVAAGYVRITATSWVSERTGPRIMRMSWWARPKTEANAVAGPSDPFEGLV